MQPSLLSPHLTTSCQLLVLKTLFGTGLAPFLRQQVRSHAAITQCPTKNLPPLGLLKDPSLGRFCSRFT